ncbi:glycerol-3-phosphate 1-O-acyltransferase PlsY [uncultured Ferrovibrio sp.]|jgi:glycerol-3-phosphate acyltransferase PlsY|uniref:glycerol-3-phosphate 1-O-acyltransferase PlsY n=1 Tax=uncultured Ferrovibrio sp. TaxID=1576913 RepID=UPI00260A8871|nr:glycerol-3-phosphate 1-O-acyltransferase PlsY [uncultured Ferrovibrio sp.]
MPDPASWSMDAPYYLAAIVLGYILGSIPFGLVLTKLSGLGDIRQIGSGNIGATNVLRTGRKDLAALTLLLDGGKGAAAALLGGMYGPDIMVSAAFAAFIGHLFPVWLKFKGGKGVATYLGVLLGAAWPAGLFACATWLAVAVIFRYSSLAALMAALATPVFTWFFVSPQVAELAGAMTVLVYIRHHENIARLLRGEEPKIGKKKTSEDQAATPQ